MHLDSAQRAVRVQLTPNYDFGGSKFSSYVCPYALGTNYDQFQRFIRGPPNCYPHQDRKALPSVILRAHPLVTSQRFLAPHLV